MEARPALNTQLPNLNDVAVVHDADEVGPLNGAEPVGYDEHGAVLCGSVQCLLHHPLWFSVQGAGGLVQHQDAGVLDQGAGDGDTLLLAARQRHASFTCGFPPQECWSWNLGDKQM